MSDLKEYIVTSHNWEELDALCADIEAGTGPYTPDRKVEVANPRPMSKNTHYYLTADEATLLSADSRVLAVELDISELGIVPKLNYMQTSTNWAKTNSITNLHKNWALLRCTLPTQITNYYLYYNEERPNTGIAYPKSNFTS